MKVLLAPQAQKQFDQLPTLIKVRVLKLFERLSYWPRISGAKPLRGNLAGQYRLRTGDYRVQFWVDRGIVMIVAIGHRDGFYDE